MRPREGPALLPGHRAGKKLGGALQGMPSMAALATDAQSSHSRSFKVSWVVLSPPPTTSPLSRALPLSRPGGVREQGLESGALPLLFPWDERPGALNVMLGFPKEAD